MAIAKMKTCKEDFKKYILEAAKILTEKAGEIVEDIDTSRVCKVSISLDLYPFEVPELKVSKSYCPMGD